MSLQVFNHGDFLRGQAVEVEHVCRPTATIRVRDRGSRSFLAFGPYDQVNAILSRNRFHMTFRDDVQECLMSQLLLELSESGLDTDFWIDFKVLHESVLKRRACRL